LPGFAFIWLFPRLLNFDLAHPKLSISITTDTGSAGFSGSEADVGICYGNGDNPRFMTEPLMGEEVFPVCAPSLLTGQQPLRSIADLANHTRLCDEFAPFVRDPPTWDYWARENDLVLPQPERTRSFGQSNMVIQAAIEGVGVALGRGPLVINALCDGRLVRPFSQTAQSQLKYWLVYARALKETDKIRLFIDWIRSEAKNKPVFPESASHLDCPDD
jgi:LysR family glycine cleavage system transcriptional activator